MAKKSLSPVDMIRQKLGMGYSLVVVLFLSAAAHGYLQMGDWEIQVTAAQEALERVAETGVSAEALEPMQAQITAMAEKASRDKQFNLLFAIVGIIAALVIMQRVISGIGDALAKLVYDLKNQGK